MLEDMMESICGEGLITSFSPTISGLESAASAIYNVVSPCAATLVIVFFILALLDSVTRELFTFDVFLRQLVTLVIAIAIINNGWNLVFGGGSLPGLIPLGESITSSVASSVGISNGSSEETSSSNTSTDSTGTETTTTQTSTSAAVARLNAYREEQKDNSSWALTWLVDVLIFGQLCIPYALSFIMKILAQVICYSRIIEVYVLGAFAPIALADIFKNGMQSNGMRFIKEIFALGLQGAIIVAIASLYGAIASDAITSADFWTFILQTLVAGVAACALLMKSQSIARKVVGV